MGYFENIKVEELFRNDEKYNNEQQRKRKKKQVTTEQVAIW